MIDKLRLVKGGKIVEIPPIFCGIIYGMEFLIIFLLIIINGIFAMTEIAIVSARKPKLKQMADMGDKNAKRALELAENPSRFLSTVQIGITFIGIFAGAYGGETVAEFLSAPLSTIPIIGDYGETIAIIIVVSIITYLSLILGELVPKRVALSSPERIASFMARSMQTLSSISYPLVNFLSVSTDWVLGIFGIKKSPEMPISEEEVKMLIREGARIGVFNLAERDIVERTFRLSDMKVNMLMTPRKEIKWLDIAGGSKNIKRVISQSSYSYFPVCKKDMDKVIGIVRTKELLAHYFLKEEVDLKDLMHKPIFVPEGMNAFKVLEIFKKSGIHMAMAVDEYGNIEGLLSITDILEAIIGDIPTIDEYEEKNITKWKDGTFLIDGLVTLDEFKEYFQIRKLPKEESGIFQTIGGFVMNQIGHVPKSGNSFESNGYCFEVIDMDGSRVDKILVRKIL